MFNIPLLSICIPTYNRAQYLKEALESILNQIHNDNKDKVEICVSDNASNDYTEILVKKYKKRSPVSIVYHKNLKNMGADYNYLKAVEIAKGKYCWLLGSDDVIEKDGINKILFEIQNNSHIDIFTFRRFVYTKDMRYKSLHEVSPPKLYSLGKDYIFRDKIECLKYTAGIWGYISTIVVNREKWLSVKGYEKWVGSAYVHLYIIYYLIKNNSLVKFVNEPLVGWRSNNDSFYSSLGDYGRFKIDINYVHIASDVFGKESKEYKIVKNMLINRFGFWGRIIGAKIKKVPNFSKNAYRDLYPIYKDHWKFWLWYVPLMITPSFIYRLILRPHIYRYLLELIKKIKNRKTIMM